MTGEPISSEILHYLDASDLRFSNWTRFVNCALREIDNNLEIKQHFENIYYITKRPILRNEEFFIDYGENYRTINLKMTGPY